MGMFNRMAMGAGLGGWYGLNSSALGGMFMKGDQSQIAGTGFGAAAGAAMFAGGRSGRFMSGTVKSMLNQIFRKGPPVPLGQQLKYSGLGLGITASALIGSTILESNSPRR
jgi:hypothetical protein